MEIIDSRWIAVTDSSWILMVPQVKSRVAKAADASAKAANLGVLTSAMTSATWK